MKDYSLEHLSDATLVRDLTALVRRERATTAELLAHLAEVDERRLYLPAGYPSMFEYCVAELRFSEDAACRRIRAARAARDFPGLFAAIAEGRLHVSAVVALAPHLTRGNVEELITAATHRGKAAIEQLLADRFPRSETLALVQALPAQLPSETGEGLSAPARMNFQPLRPTIAPIAPERYAIQVSIGKETHDLLRHARELLSHQIPSGDLAAVLEKLIALGVRQLEKKKLAAVDHPQAPRENTSADPRHIPAEVRRAVWERDGGQCTFTSTSGHRCPARTLLELDHVEPVARGGRSTIENLRLRCRAHNQMTAERAFGSDFMREKRQAAATRSTSTSVPSRADEVVPWLRSLGCRAEASREAARMACEELSGAPIEDLLKRAISYFGRRPQCVNERASRPEPTRAGRPCG